MHADEKILEVARTWLGVPYRKAGRTRHRGVDCLNYIGLSFHGAGVITELPAWEDYEYGFWKKPGDPIVEAIERALEKVGEDIEIERYVGEDIPPRDQWRPGDFLCVCQLRKLEKTTHTVIVEQVEQHAVTILHARQGRGGKVERTQLPQRWQVHRLYRAIGWVA